MQHEGARDRAYGQEYRPTLIDRCGVWLSSAQIRRQVPSFRGKRIGDFGCGYHAAISRPLLDQVASALLLDVAVAADLKAHPRVRVIEGVLPAALDRIDSACLDIVFCLSVLEHLWDPLEALRQFHRMAADRGVCLFNVPSWRGKRFLEFSAFRLGLSPTLEMDDHKMYYDVRDFWPLLVRAGFIPHNIRCFPHKFGLNTFAVCGVDKTRSV
jgi:SAM-dependent methyltransferase